MLFHVYFSRLPICTLLPIVFMAAVECVKTTNSVCVRFRKSTAKTQVRDTSSAAIFNFNFDSLSKNGWFVVF